MKTHSIRFRLTVWYAAILTASLSIFGGLLWFSLYRQLNVDLDRELAGRSAALESYFRTESAELKFTDVPAELDEFCQGLPPDIQVNLHSANGFVFQYPPGRTDSVPSKNAEFSIRELRRQFVYKGEVFYLEMGASTEDMHHTLDLLRVALLILMPVVVVGACAGGAWLSGRALRPVQEVTNAALAISIENLSQRLPVPPTGDELSQLANVLNSMLGRLESAVKTLSQFAADASHELRTPVAVIRTTAELALRRERTPESYRESLGSIEQEAVRMTQLIEDLLTLARNDAGKAELLKTPVDVRDVLNEVCQEMQDLAVQREVCVRRLLDGEPAIVTANRPALHRLFLVLLDNALKYSGAGSDVNVTVRGNDAKVSVTIQDFGCGIRADHLPHIFQRFYRSADQPNNTSGNHGLGHGLGLSLAESIARIHETTIVAQSVEGEGAEFSIAFARRNANRTHTEDSHFETQKPIDSGKLAGI